MGIPKYFLHVIKSYSETIQNISLNPLNIDNFYLDCNSIVYDAVHEFNVDESITDDKIINVVIDKINNYINIVKPKCLTFVALDGIAPFAKLNQQRKRRFKSSVQKQYEQLKMNWDTAAITPGTEFMNKLNNKLNTFYSKNNNVIVSDSSMKGEGEHKIFQHLRENNKNNKHQNNVIYGLDADLIMLSMLHSNIYLFRETSAFIKNSFEFNCNYNYYININKLKNVILNQLTTENKSIHDYILFCFLIGNDFIPHSPSINIKYNGIFQLIDAYNKLNLPLYDVQNEKIIWTNFKKYISLLKKNENKQINYILNKRNKYNVEMCNKLKNMNINEQITNSPILDISTEKYINPVQECWQNRYYSSLFGNTPINFICLNYIESIEWTMKYYTKGCMNWMWSYKYNYAPLFEDLIKFIPLTNDVSIIKDNLEYSINENMQLCYVLPKTSLHLLPISLKNKIHNKEQNWYVDKENCFYSWAFCTYFWEAHPLLPEIDINELISLIKT